MKAWWLLSLLPLAAFSAHAQSSAEALDLSLPAAPITYAGDPPGTYTYDVSIDGEPRGEFVFCAIEVPDQNPNTDPRDLNCPNKFNAVERERPRAGKAG